jgi:hypothetical protein
MLNLPHKHTHTKYTHTHTHTHTHSLTHTQNDGNMGGQAMTAHGSLDPVNKKFHLILMGLWEVRVCWIRGVSWNTISLAKLEGKSDFWMIWLRQYVLDKTPLKINGAEGQPGQPLGYVFHLTRTYHMITIELYSYVMTTSRRRYKWY